MSLSKEDLVGEFKFFGSSKLIYSKGLYFNFHFPLALSRLMGLEDGDRVQIFVDIPKKIVVLKVFKEEKKARKK